MTEMRLKTIRAIICFVFIANCVYAQYTSTRRTSSSVSSKRQTTQRQTSRTNRSKNSTYNKRPTPTRPSVRARVKTNSVRSTTSRERFKPNYKLKKPMTRYKPSTGISTNSKTPKRSVNRASANSKTPKLPLKYTSRISAARSQSSMSTYKPITSNVPIIKSSRYRLKRDTYYIRKLSSRRKSKNDFFAVIDYSKNDIVSRYSDYNVMDAMMFGNMMFSIFFHDYYDHSVSHSFLWHYHHQDYDISHWSDKQIQLYHHFMNYYKGQGIEPDARYVDPGTSPDENYIYDFVEANAEDFYGKQVEVISVNKLPDEESLAKEFSKHIISEPPEPEKEEFDPGRMAAIGFFILCGLCSLPFLLMQLAWGSNNDIAAFGLIVLIVMWGIIILTWVSV